MHHYCIHSEALTACIKLYIFCIQLYTPPYTQVQRLCIKSNDYCITAAQPINELSSISPNAKVQFLQTELNSKCVTIMEENLKTFLLAIRETFGHTVVVTQGRRRKGFQMSARRYTITYYKLNSETHIWDLLTEVCDTLGEVVTFLSTLQVHSDDMSLISVE